MCVPRLRTAGVVKVVWPDCGAEFAISGSDYWGVAASDIGSRAGAMVLRHDGAGRLRPPAVRGERAVAVREDDGPHAARVRGRGQSPDEDGFGAFVAYIAEHGFEAHWRQYRNNYLELDGWRYWAMPGRGDSSITIVNRERLPGQPLRRVVVRTGTASRSALVGAG